LSSVSLNSLLFLRRNFRPKLRHRHRKPFIDLENTLENRHLTVYTVYIISRWLGSRVVNVLDSGAERPGFKSQQRFTVLRQTVHTHCASVHQAAKLVGALLRVAGVTAGLAECIMVAYRRVYDSRHLQADCQEPGSATVIEYGLSLHFTSFLLGVRDYQSLESCSLILLRTKTGGYGYGNWNMFSDWVGRREWNLKWTGVGMGGNGID